MKREDRDRFLIALGVALGFHLAVALLLLLVPMDQSSDFVRSRAPVSIRFEVTTLLDPGEF